MSALQTKYGIQPNIPQSCTIKTHKQKYEIMNWFQGREGGRLVMYLPSFPLNANKVHKVHEAQISQIN